MADQDLNEKKRKFIEKQKQFQAAVYELSEAWEDRELADAIHSNEKIMEIVQQIFPMSVDEWWHGIAHMTEVLEKEFSNRLTVRQLRSELYELLTSDTRILVYDGKWYYYVKGVSTSQVADGGLPVIELGDAFDSRDL